MPLAQQASSLELTVGRADLAAYVPHNVSGGLLVDVDAGMGEHGVRPGDQIGPGEARLVAGDLHRPIMDGAGPDTEAGVAAAFVEKRFTL